jgi:ATP adenylyltransferase
LAGTGQSLKKKEKEYFFAYNWVSLFSTFQPANLRPSNPMNHLWSPWRMTYIENHKKEEGCVFCIAQAQADSAENLIAFRGKNAYVILNRFPYTSGHLMAIPYEHKSNLEELAAETRAEMMELASLCTTVLRKIYRTESFNVGINIGEAAGAGVLGHVHIHIVPRWAGDTNFMSTTGEMRVLPEALEDTYHRVREGFLKNI